MKADRKIYLAACAVLLCCGTASAFWPFSSGDDSKAAQTAPAADAAAAAPASDAAPVAMTAPTGAATDVAAAPEEKKHGFSLWPFGRKKKADDKLKAAAIPDISADGRTLEQKIEANKPPKPVSQFDNDIKPAIEKPDYDKILADLKVKLNLTKNQIKRLESTFKDDQKKFDQLGSRYAETGALLTTERQGLMKIREQIEKTIDGIPEVVMQKLEPDQKDDYNELLDREQKAAKKAVADAAPATPVVIAPAKDEPKPLPSPFKKKKKRTSLKKKIKLPKAEAPAVQSDAPVAPDAAEN